MTNVQPDNSTFGMVELVDDLTTDEGMRLRIYVDTAGKVTVGVGRNLSDRGISHDEAGVMLLNDIALVAMQLDASQPWWRTLDAPRQRVMINLGFNMGVPTLNTFHQFLDLMQQHDWQGAAADLEGTKWYGQVGERGPRMVSRILAGASADLSPF